MAPVAAILARAGHKVTEVVFPAGEESKRLGTLERICEELVRHGLDRSSFLVALGGGVTGDITGFAAASFMRGIPYVQIPTTLLAQVDSSVGGKTGVNLASGKNLVGAFWQPRLVLADIETLLSLSDRDFREGMAEVIKYGVIWDSEFFTWLEENAAALMAKDVEALSHIVEISCRIKAQVVEADEREGGLRAILNYGHTFGHGIEKVTEYRVLRHGEAVSIGMVAAGRTAALLDLLGADDVRRIERLLTTYGLPVKLPENVNVASLMASFASDKKATGGRPKFVLPTRIGAVKVTADVGAEVLAAALSHLSE